MHQLIEYNIKESTNRYLYGVPLEPCAKVALLHMTLSVQHIFVLEEIVFQQQQNIKGTNNNINDITHYAVVERVFCGSDTSSTSLPQHLLNILCSFG